MYTDELGKLFEGLIPEVLRTQSFLSELLDDPLVLWGPAVTDTFSATSTFDTGLHPACALDAASTTRN